MTHSATQIRVGVPLTGGRLVAAARERRYLVLFSANAFARTYPKGHEREGFFKGFRRPDCYQFDGLDAALDSAGFVAAVHYGDYRWTVEDYFDLVQSHPWAWYAAMDYCCEPQIAQDRPLRLLRMAATARMLGRCRAARPAGADARPSRLDPGRIRDVRGMAPAVRLARADRDRLGLPAAGSRRRRHSRHPRGRRCDSAEACSGAPVRRQKHGVRPDRPSPARRFRRFDGLGRASPR